MGAGSGAGMTRTIVIERVAFSAFSWGLDIADAGARPA